MPKIRNSVSRTTRFRRYPYSHLPERAPLPDLVALHENGTLFSDPRAMTESAIEEEIAGTLKLKSRSEFKAQLHPHPRPSNLESQTEEDELPSSEIGHNTSSHLPADEHLTYPLTPSNPHPNIQDNHFLSSNPSTQAKSNSISPYSLHQRRRGLPNLRVITSSTHLAELRNRNLSNPSAKISLLGLKQRELETQASQTQQNLRFQNPISESQMHRNNGKDQERKYHTRKTRNHYVPTPPRKPGKIRSRTNVPPHPRTRFSFTSESPDPSQYMCNPGIISSNRIAPSTLSSSLPPPQLLPPPLSNPLTPTQYISAILSLRASTRNPDHFPLPPGIQLLQNFPQENKKKTTKMKRIGEKEINFLALQMEQVEDAIRLEGAPEEAREVYYAQFARGEY
ncbi:uncharacterized protein Bfra_005966 [Botrytis fragariae]|uniref:Uncharacterized protein n=1 Tax=Botrytis fragariae TaxID=1964551 RepID=A0A8H6ASG9_9HELO|nr:uncharacterized protein Bfra_005966 [Botrytis fragariae]KAF5872605.1 hypothetical protein Bfra_005966 [Botrytis fragariae]